MKKTTILSIFLVVALAFCGCSANSSNTSQAQKEITVSNTADNIIKPEEAFTDRDLNYDYTDRDTYYITLKDNGSTTDTKNVSVSNNVIKIKTEGVYILKGSLSNGQIVIDADDDDKIQLVLNSVSINCDDSSAIYCKNAKKVFVTTMGDSELSNKKDFADEKINAVIFSKSNLTLNGNAKLAVIAKYGNSVTCKDDLVIASGEYNLNAQNHALKANDSVRIADASIKMQSNKDGIHCESDDEDKGYIYIESGSIIINAGDDGIQSSSAVKITGGNVDIKQSNEGIESRFIDIAGGVVNVKSADDGFNATDKSNKSDDTTENENAQNDQQEPPDMKGNLDDRMTEQPTDMQDKIQGPKPDLNGKQMPNDKFGDSGADSSDCSLTISGGKITVDASGDGLDSNGIIKITGGETIVYGAEDNGNSALDYNTQATITGGTVVAIGMSGMAMGFSDSSTQCSILYELDNEGNAGDKLELKKDNKTLVSVFSIKKYNSVLISCPELIKGKYSISAGELSDTIELNALSYSNSKGNQFGMKKRNPINTDNRP